VAQALPISSGSPSVSRVSNARKAGRVSTISVPGQSRQKSNLVIAQTMRLPRSHRVRRQGAAGLDHDSV